MTARAVTVIAILFSQFLTDFRFERAYEAGSDCTISNSSSHGAPCGDKSQAIYGLLRQTLLNHRSVSQHQSLFAADC